MGPFSAQEKVCDNKEMIKKIRRVIDELDNANVVAKCCCTDPKNPPEGSKVVYPQCLDGKEAVPRIVPSNKDKYIWIPPVMDTRMLLDASHSCFSATVANQHYDQYEGCKLRCQRVSHSEGPHSHWWNAAVAAGGPSSEGCGGGGGPSSGRCSGSGPSSGGSHGARDYCEDPDFVPPEPLGHMAWTNEPGGACKHPQYCKAHCFEHAPPVDWARNH